VSLLTDTTNFLKVLEEAVVAKYPVTVNSAPPPQEPGTARTPSSPVSCANSKTVAQRPRSRKLTRPEVHGRL
jgi:hypothetical protein